MLKFTNDERLNLARGLVLNATSEHKFGAVDNMSIGANGTIWTIADTVYPWSSWATAGTVTVLTVNAGDNGKTIRIIGLDENYNFVSEDIVVSSTGNVNGTQTFSRVYRGYVYNGSSTNVADINVQKGGTTVLRIPAGLGQTLMCVYTVAAGYTGYLTQINCTTETNHDVIGNLFIKPFGGVFRIAHTFEVAYSQYFYKFDVPIKITEKSDIDFRATSRTNNTRITGAFDIILLKD